MKKTHLLTTLCGLFFMLLATAPDSDGQSLRVRPWKEIHLQPELMGPKTRLRAFSRSQRGDFYFADEGLNRIFRTDSLGRMMREVGGFGWENEQFDGPRDIWAENALDVFVADYNNHRIQRYNRKLEFIASYVNDPNRDEKLQFGFPVAVAYSHFNELFLAGAENHRILRFDMNGRPVQSFGDYDWGAGSLEQPAAICIGGEDEIFVADGTRQAVVRFDYYGNFLQEITHADMKRPGNLAFGKHFLFVVDDATSRIFVFDNQGEHIVHFLPSFATDSAAGGSRLDLAVADNILYILNCSSGIIYCYKIE